MGLQAILEWVDGSSMHRQREAQATLASQLASISQYQAVIEFQLDGTIVTANENFLKATGYTLGEIQGKHHSIFVDPGYRQTQEYRMFWEKLSRGEADGGQYKRFRKDGQQVWLQASYNPILGLDGKPCKVIKYASDITAAKIKEGDQASQLGSISKYQAVIEFQLDGTIVTANENFLKATGYTLGEIQGKHHSIFVDPAYRQTPEYRMFWDKLGRGEADGGQYKRFRKDGQEVWLQASYNPILDLSGKPSKVIKYASDITASKRLEEQNRLEGQRAAQVSTAINGVSTAIMMVNRDFVVTYVNQSTVELLAKNAEAFRAIWPNFDSSKIVGSCIDMFHKNPSHQRQMLADPSRLPYRTDISVGPLKFSLCVNAVYDQAKQYSGNILEWADVTAQRRAEAVNASQLAAISKHQAVIEFQLDGTIVTANENFLRVTGYSLSEIQGKHHSIFVDPAYRQTQNYRMFWEKLGRGEPDGGQYQRLRKDGSEVWLQASYSPILDQSGKPFKVMKYASDITASKLLEKQAERAMQETGRVMKALASGDLRESMTGEYDGEFAVLRDSVNGCANNLRDMVNQIRNAASSIGTSATEISQGNTDLSQRTEQQAASIEETASSMEELTGTVKQNADNARQANQLATSAREQAEKGGAVVGTAVSAMSAINEASKKIADIIGVIDEIAFQTNLLALNAAVEAARAGEQGRGFAVVAAEVRNLAQRSAGAAKEIKTLIKDSVSKVEEGSRLVNESGSTLQQIVGAVKKVSDIIAEIAEASTEQSAGIDRISQAVTQMDQAVQQNAALVEQAAAASGSMDDQSRSLAKLMSMFRIGEGDEGGEVAAPTVRPAARRPAASPQHVAASSASRPPGRPPARPAQGRSGGGTALAEAPAGGSGSGKWEEF